ncbi:MAG: zinc-binding dehydrogenase [Eubacteriales bacterium]|nr:zinc-binding dehydrogenase [Eubacteriales bacterium]
MSQSNIPDKMRAVVLTKPTAAEDVVLSEIDVPKVHPGWVLVRIKALGLNHSEQILRLHEIEADYIQKPIIPGIECVGEIEDPSDTNFAVGQKVVALMGGMGRSFNGGYAEYALLPAHHVFAIESNLPWKEIAAVPETYFTAWGSLFECLNLKPEDTLLVRGATCALGYAAVQIAKTIGCKVIATTHREEKLPLLEEADIAIVDDGDLRGKIEPVTKVLELVGPKTLRNSLLLVKKQGIVCNTGVLGNVFALNNFDPIKAIPNGVYLTGFHSNFPTQEIMKDIFEFIQNYGVSPKIGASYKFDDITQAMIDMDNHKVNGKMVVEM